MAKVDVVCPQCNETHGVRCNGHSASGTRRYICKHCSKTFQLNFSYSGAKPDTHQIIVDMAMNGSGCRDTARVPGISLNTALRHLKKFRQNRSLRISTPKRKSLSAVKLMSNGLTCDVKPIPGGCSTLMLVSANVFSPMSLVHVTH